MTVITQMADNPRILMVTRPITFCRTNLNLALFGRNGAIISRSHDFEAHLRPFIRFTCCLSCELTLDWILLFVWRVDRALSTLRLSSLRSRRRPRTERRVFRSGSRLAAWARDACVQCSGSQRTNRLIQIVKNAWREDGRLNQSVGARFRRSFRISYSVGKVCCGWR